MEIFKGWHACIFLKLSKDRKTRLRKSNFSIEGKTRPISDPESAAVLGCFVKMDFLGANEDYKKI